MVDAYALVEKHNQLSGGDCPINEYRQFIANTVLDYARRDSTNDIIIEYSPLTMDSYTKKFTDLFKCLINVGRPHGPKNARVVHLEPYEMLWEDKHEKYNSFTKQVEYLSEFLDRMIVTESRISADDINDVDEIAKE
jgi:hypothetical protein